MTVGKMAPAEPTTLSSKEDKQQESGCPLSRPPPPYPDPSGGTLYPLSELRPCYLTQGGGGSCDLHKEDQLTAHKGRDQTKDVTGGGDPGSPLGSGTESPADHMGPEEGKDESKRVEYSQGSSHLLNDLLKEMENAARGTDQQTAQDALQEGSHPTLPVWDRGTQIAPTTGMPGMNAGKSTKAAVHKSVRKQPHRSDVLFIVFGDVDEDGWFLGELTDGTRGLVPSNVVVEVSDDELDTTMPLELCDLLLDTDD
ncbi:uncharacterized protein LOC124418082 [Gallus gallus]|uniref:uncharacterized protein LOC124418082 n=1 Tax=Gallus gallus TaxID=9031 RepID=UPI001F018C24|nr:uncharacterized protein LOC124418082 [Gallus gallus]